MLLGIIPASAQFSISSQQVFGGSGADQMRWNAHTVMPDGGYLFPIMSDSPVSGTQTSGTYGVVDCWLVRTTPDGTVLWQKNLGGTDMEDIAVATVSNNAIYVSMASSSDVSGNKTTPVYGSSGADRADIWLLKLDMDGNILWQKTLGSAKADWPAALTEMPGNRLLITAFSASDISIDKTENSKGMGDFWLLAVDNSGNKLWDRTYGGDKQDLPGGNAVAVSDGIIMSGSSYSGISADRQSPAYGLTDVWLVKVDFNGNLVWETSIGGSQEEESSFVSIINGKIIVAGSTKSSMSGNLDIPLLSLKDGWIAELDMNGNLLRTRGFRGYGNETVIAVHPLYNGGYMVFLSSNSGVGGDKTIPSMGQEDIWIVYLDAAWNITGQFGLGGTAQDLCIATAISSDQTVMIASNSVSGIGGNKTLSHYGNGDIWFLKLSHLASLSEETASLLRVYPNPAENNCQIVLPEGVDFEKLRVVNAAGQSVYETNLNPTEGGTYTLNTTSWAPGAYFIDLQNKQGISLRSTLLKK